MSAIATATVRTLLLVISGMHVGACAADVGSSGSADAIREVIQRTEAMNNAGDVDGWVALFEDGAVYMPPGMPALTTREGIRDTARAGFSSWTSTIAIVADEIVVTGDWAFSRARVTGKATSVKSGESVAIDMKEIVLFHRQPDGSWKIARLIGNSNRS